MAIQSGYSKKKAERYDEIFNKHKNDFKTAENVRKLNVEVEETAGSDPCDNCRIQGDDCAPCGRYGIKKLKERQRETQLLKRTSFGKGTDVSKP